MNVLIVEDEPFAASRLQKHILNLRPDWTIVGKTDGLESTLSWLHANTAPELVFLDIHLCDGSSFDLFDHYTFEMPIVFITAYDEYALEAFRVNAVDYLLKPLKIEELERAIVRVEKKPKEGQSHKLEGVLKTVRQNTPAAVRFLIKLGSTIRLVDLEEVAYFYTEDKITFLMTDAGKRYPIDQSLEKIEELVTPFSFFRINRQFVVRVSAIAEMHAHSKSRIKVVLKPNVDINAIVSSEKTPLFKKWLLGEA